MKNLLSLLLIFLFAGLSCAQRPAATPVTPKERPFEVVVSDIPKESWEPIFHESIDEVGRAVGIEPLRKQSMADSDIEVRIWAGFGLTRLKGFVVKRNGEKWSAVYIGLPIDSSGRKVKKVALAEPKSGWEPAWSLMLGQEILTLPDAAAIDCRAMYNDGYSYVVEILKGKNYRTYMYDNPAEKFDNRCVQADKIVAIAGIVTNAYGVAGFRPH